MLRSGFLPLSFKQILRGSPKTTVSAIKDRLSAAGYAQAPVAVWIFKKGAGLPAGEIQKRTRSSRPLPRSPRPTPRRGAQAADEQLNRFENLPALTDVSSRP